MSDEYRDRLVKAIDALSDLYAQQGSIGGQVSTEMERLRAKREGVQLALSYYDEEVE